MPALVFIVKKLQYRKIQLVELWNIIERHLTFHHANYFAVKHTIMRYYCIRKIVTFSIIET